MTAAPGRPRWGSVSGLQTAAWIVLVGLVGFGAGRASWAPDALGTVDARTLDQLLAGQLSEDQEARALRWLEGSTNPRVASFARDGGMPRAARLDPFDVEASEPGQMWEEPVVVAAMVVAPVEAPGEVVEVRPLDMAPLDVAPPGPPAEVPEVREAQPLEVPSSTSEPELSPEPVEEVVETQVVAVSAPEPEPEPEAEGAVPVALVASGGVDVWSGRAEDAVKRVLDAQMGALTRCYSEALRRDVTVAGTVDLEWNVFSGRVSDLVVEDGTGDEELGGCVGGVVRHLRFPSEVRGQISWPVVMSQG